MMNNKICFYMTPFPRVKSHIDKIDAAVEYGLSAIEAFSNFELENPDIEMAKKIKEYADRKGIKIPCISVFADFSPEDNNSEIERLKKYADVAKVLGASYLHHTIIPEFECAEKVLNKKDELYQRGINAVREIYDYADKLGVKTIYEDQGYIFNGIEGFGNFLKDVERDVGVVADFGNIQQTDTNIEEFLKNFSNRVVHAHFKDVKITDNNDSGTGLRTLSGNYMHDTIIGEGDVDIECGIKLLKAAGYDGYFGLEFGIDDDNSPVMKNVLNYLDSLL